MTRRITLLGLCALLFPLALVFPALSQEKERAHKPTAKEQEMMKKWVAAGTPGAEHDLLKKRCGTFKVECKFWMRGPGTKPTVSTGRATIRPIFGGRFIEEHYKGQGFGGMPFEGRGITGYDNFRKQYTCLWIDSMGTATYVSRGVKDPKANVIRFYGTMDEPMTGEIAKPVTYVLRIVDERTTVFEMHDSAYGENGKVGELTYTRID